MILGGNANNSTNAGLGNCNTNYGFGNTNTNIGRRAGVDTGIAGVKQLLAEHKGLVERQNTKKEDNSG